MSDIRALTVHQPWAWAIAYGGKTVENRTRPLSYRGRLLIHAGLKLSHAPLPDRNANVLLDRIGGRGNVWEPARRPIRHHWGHPGLAQGAVIAVADLVDCHPATASRAMPCCQPWGEPGRHHLVLDGVRALPEPVPCRGWQGLWIPDPDLCAKVDRLLDGAG